MDTNNHYNLDIRTLIVLLTENEISRDTVFGLLARECNVPVDKLIEAVTVKPAKPEPEKNDKRIRWTPERIETLVDMWNKGIRPGEIARAFECNTQVIYQKISTLRRTRTDIKPRVSHNPFFKATAPAVMPSTALEQAAHTA